MLTINPKTDILHMHLPKKRRKRNKVGCERSLKTK